jgi:hypothetical protein
MREVAEISTLLLYDLFHRESSDWPGARIGSFLFTHRVNLLLLLLLYLLTTEVIYCLSLKDNKSEMDIL